MLKIAHNALYAHPLPVGHRFPMEKYELIPEQLLYEGTVQAEQFFDPPPVPEALVTRVHSQAYWTRLKHLQLDRLEERRTGFPLSARLVERELCITNGTVLGAQAALAHGIALNVAGGTHHAYADRGEGFCLLNDQAVAAQYLLDASLARRVLIVDLDVHQGQGTAEIFAHEPRVFTFSMHGADNYPHRKARSDLDIALPTGTTDAQYLELLRLHLPRLLDQHRPDFVFYLAGVDVLATDRLGKLALSPAGCYERDWYVLSELYRAGLPVFVSLGGGYSPRIADIVNAHCNTFRLAARIWRA